MNQLRVLIIRNAYQKDTGGAEQYAFNLALALKRAGHVPMVVTKHQAIRDKCAAEGINSISGIWHESQEWGKHYYLRFILMPLWYMILILFHRIDVVHPQSRDDFVFATKAAEFLGKKVVWTDHADLKYIMDRVKRPHPRMQNWIANAARYTSAIIEPSRSEKRSVSKVAPDLSDKLKVVHNGVFVPDNLIPVPKRKKHIIGTNARLVPAKGIGELLEAFASLSKSINHLELWLVGGTSGNEAYYKKKAKELGVLSAVKFIGYVNDPNDYVVSMDIFVHASYHEAFSLAIIEACMLGRPVVATNTGGTPEIINDKTGILIPTKNARAIAVAVNRLLRDTALRNKLGIAAEKLAREEFDFQKITEQKVIPIYEGRMA